MEVLCGDRFIFLGLIVVSVGEASASYPGIWTRQSEITGETRREMSWDSPSFITRQGI